MLKNCSQILPKTIDKIQGLVYNITIDRVLKHKKDTC